MLLPEGVILQNALIELVTARVGNIVRSRGTVLCPRRHEDGTFGGHHVIISSSNFALEEIPDEYLCWLNKGYQPCLGTISGQLYLTSLGYSFYREQLFNAYIKQEADPNQGMLTQEEFDGRMQEHFQRVRRSVHARMCATQRKLDKLTAFIV